MDLNEIEFSNIGSWKTLHQTLTILLCCFALSGLFFYYVTLPKMGVFDKTKAKELTLKSTFQAKAALSSNLEEYKLQKIEMQLIFETLLGRLPSKSEVARLLDDISFIGQENGLKFKSISWGKTQQLKLSLMVPVRMEIEGKFKAFGQFAADIATLPRLLILDDITIERSSQGNLKLSVVAKTYRYTGDIK